MSRILIVADDLTGANDTGVRFAKCGAKVFTVLDKEHVNWEKAGDCDCITLSTDSRGLPPREAYERVHRAVRKFSGRETILYSKRIDSTLRGNLGAETDAMLDALADDRMAVVVPAFPEAGRTYVGGHLLVCGVPLFRTAAASDPQNPMTTASALKLYREQSSRKVWELSLEQMKEGAERIAQIIREQYAEGVRCLIFDGAQEVDLITAAEGIAASGIPFVAVDPGAFSAKIWEILNKEDIGEKRPREQKKILFVVGSVNPVAVRQVEQLASRQDVGRVLLDTEGLLESEKARKEETERAASEVMEVFRTKSVCALCTSGILPGSKIDLFQRGAQMGIRAEEVSRLLNQALGDTARRIVAARPDMGGMFACGGDVAVALCDALGAWGEYPLEEVIPLAVYGRLAGGAGDGLHMITKGGMVGDEETMVVCLEYLKKCLNGDKFEEN
ncbi:MAG: hypothetical protein K2O06_13095 [Acetatifactor sp.]|nr:hypothetical protein [Acetatifactor sp.]